MVSVHFDRAVVIYISVPESRSHSCHSPVIVLDLSFGISPARPEGYGLLSRLLEFLSEKVPADKVVLAKEFTHELERPLIHYGIEDIVFSGKSVHICFGFRLVAGIGSLAHLEQPFLCIRLASRSAFGIVGDLGGHQQYIRIPHIYRLGSVIVSVGERMVNHPVIPVFSEIPVHQTCRHLDIVAVHVFLPFIVDTADIPAGVVVSILVVKRRHHSDSASPVVGSEVACSICSGRDSERIVPATSVVAERYNEDNFLACLEVEIVEVSPELLVARVQIET